MADTYLDHAPQGPRGRHWTKLIRAWERSGLSQAEFCRRHSLSVFSFRWWKWALSRARRCARTDVPRFLPVQVVAARPGGPASPLEIELRGGRKILLRPGFDPDCLRQAVTVLEATPC